MTERGKGTCACERCGNYCNHQQSHCDSCQEVARLREAMDGLIRSETRCCHVYPRGPAWDTARKTLEETPW